MGLIIGGKKPSAPSLVLPKKTSPGTNVKVLAEKAAARPVAGATPKFVRPAAGSAAKKLEEATSGDFMKLRDGKNRLVVLPATAEMETDGYPWIEVSAHWPGGKDAMATLGFDNRPDEIPMSVGCAKFHEKRPCALCDTVDKLYKSVSPADKKLARALKANIQCFANAVDLSAPKVVRPLKFGVQIRNDLLRAIDAGHDFFDPDALREVHVYKQQKKGSKDPSQVEYSATVARAVIDAATIKRLMPVWIPQLTDLSKFRSDIPTFDQLQDIVDTLLAARETQVTVEDVSISTEEVEQESGIEVGDDNPF